MDSSISFSSTPGSSAVTVMSFSVSFTSTHGEKGLILSSIVRKGSVIKPWVKLSIAGQSPAEEHRTVLILHV